MGKTRDLFKKIRDTKGTFHAKMGSIKDTNGMGLAFFMVQLSCKYMIIGKTIALTIQTFVSKVN